MRAQSIRIYRKGDKNPTEDPLKQTYISVSAEEQIERLFFLQWDILGSGGVGVFEGRKKSQNI